MLVSIGAEGEEHSADVMRIIIAAAGHNLRLLRAWLAWLLALLASLPTTPLRTDPARQPVTASACNWRSSRATRYYPEWLRYFGGLADKVDSYVAPIDKSGVGDKSDA